MDKTRIFEYNLTMNNAFDIVFREDLIQIFSSITEAFNMRMSVLDLNMKEIVPMEVQPICSYCSMIQNKFGLLESCHENDAIYCNKAVKSKSPISYTCHAGLREAIFPIFIDGDPIGFFIVGQFSTTDSIPLPLLKNCRSTEEQEELKTEFRKITALKEDRLNSIIRLLEITTEYVIDKKIVSIKRNILADKILNFLMEDLRLNPSAEEAAKAVGMSTSSVNKALKQTVGLSFKQYSNKIRLEAAKENLEKDPLISISEAALKVGIQDPLYFSRIFSRLFSCPPSNVRT